MTNWLEKIVSRMPQGGTGRNLTANPRSRLPTSPLRGLPSGILPNASIIYGVAASALLVIALYFMLFEHAWVTGLLVLLPAIGFMGFALHFIKHPH